MIDILVRVLSALLMIGMAIGLFFYVVNKIAGTWRFIRIGASTFVASQVFHIPFNMLVLPVLKRALGLDSLQEATGRDLGLLAMFLGLSAGMFEEVARYLVYRYWLVGPERTWKNSVTLGAGHGGCESIILGVFALQALIQMIVLRDADLSKILPADKVDAVQEQITYYWSLTWYEALMPAAERVSALFFHVSASVLVLQVFRRKSFLWLGAAIGFHAILDTIAVVGTIQKWNLLLLEAVVAFTVIPLASAVIVSFQEDEQYQQQQQQPGFLPIPQREDIDAETDAPSLVSDTESIQLEIA